MVHSIVLLKPMYLQLSWCPRGDILFHQPLLNILEVARRYKACTTGLWQCTCACIGCSPITLMYFWLSLFLQRFLPPTALSSCDPHLLNPCELPVLMLAFLSTFLIHKIFHCVFLVCPRVDLLYPFNNLNILTFKRKN